MCFRTRGVMIIGVLIMQTLFWTGDGGNNSNGCCKGVDL